jgi:hypothetical protein
MFVKHLQEYLDKFTQGPKGQRGAEHLGPGTVKLYEGSMVRELVACGLKLEPLCLGLEACGLYLEKLGA